MTNQNYKLIPELAGGYEIFDGAFSVIEPEATTNLITNPSAEIDLTGFAALAGAGTIAKTDDEQRRGIYSIEVTPNAGVEAGVYFGNITTTAGQWYTGSVDFLGNIGHTYRIYFATNAGVLIPGAFKYIVATGYWQRVSVTYLEGAGLGRRLYFSRNATAGTDVFYVDGWQWEEKDHDTTYCDGDKRGFVPEQQAFGWNGEVHASTSYRIEDTRAGGLEHNLDELDLKVLNVVGLGVPPLDNIEIDLQLGGSLFENTIQRARNFSLIIDITKAKYRSLSKIRKELYDWIRPTRTSIPQPLIIRYRPVDFSCGDPSWEEIEIECSYDGGLEGLYDNYHQERVELRFRIYDTQFKRVTDSGMELEYVDVFDTNYIAGRDPDGDWFALGVGVDDTVRAIATYRNLVFVGGDFLNAGGAGANRIAQYNQDTGAWTALGVGVDDIVRALDIDPQGILYVGGDFANAGGAASARMAAWDINASAWISIAGIVAAAAEVHAVKVTTQGNVYFGGLDITVGGGDSYDVVGLYNPDTAAWTNIGAPVVAATDEVVDLEIGPTGLLYCGGYFGNATEIVYSNDGTGWVVVGALGDAGFQAANKLAFDAGGFLIAAVGDVVAGVATYQGIYRFNSSAWEDYNFGTIGAAGDRVVAIDNNNILLRGANAPTAEFDQIYQLRGTWHDLAIDLPGDPVVYDMVISEGGYLYFGFDAAGGAISAFATEVSFDRETYPGIKVKGPGNMIIVGNANTNQVTYTDIDLLVDERADMILSREEFAYFSDKRGNIAYGVLTGSAFELRLVDGQFIEVYLKDNFYETGDNNNQLSGWEYVTGIVGSNTDNGKIYVEIVDDGGGFFHVELFDDSGLGAGDLQAHTASYNGAADEDLVEDNASGIGGHITIDAVVGVDVDIEVTFGLVWLVWKDKYEMIDEVTP